MFREGRASSGSLSPVIPGRLQTLAYTAPRIYFCSSIELANRVYTTNHSTHQKRSRSGRRGPHCEESDIPNVGVVRLTTNLSRPVRVIGVDAAGRRINIVRDCAKFAQLRQEHAQLRERAEVELQLPPVSCPKPGHFLRSCHRHRK